MTTQADVIMVAGAAESGSEHPIAKAITVLRPCPGLVSHPQQAPQPPRPRRTRRVVRIQCGYGSTGSDKSVVVGRLELLEAEGLRVAEELADGVHCANRPGGVRR